MEVNLCSNVSNLLAIHKLSRKFAKSTTEFVGKNIYVDFFLLISFMYIKMNARYFESIN